MRGRDVRNGFVGNIEGAFCASRARDGADVLTSRNRPARPPELIWRGRPRSPPTEPVPRPRHVESPPSTRHVPRPGSSGAPRGRRRPPLSCVRLAPSGRDAARHGRPAPRRASRGVVGTGVGRDYPGDVPFWVGLPGRGLDGLVREALIHNQDLAASAERLRSGGGQIADRALRTPAAAGRERHVRASSRTSSSACRSPGPPGRCRPPSISGTRASTSPGRSTCGASSAPRSTPRRPTWPPRPRTSRALVSASQLR